MPIPSSLRWKIALVLFICASPISLHAWRSDQGDGTYRNPPLYADYPDPDIIRVGSDFYLVSTTFVNTPGIRILHSRDLVNWEIVGHVVNRLEGRPEYDLAGGSAYRSGLFAASLRHYDGVFYLAVTPVRQNTRIYCSTDIHGPWKYHELDAAAFDPGLFIAADGTGYIMTSGGWDGTGTLLTLSRDFSRIVARKKVFYIKGAEGSKVVRRGEWYYLFNSIPSRLALTVSRSHSLSGPWETRFELDDRTGGHQGAIVDLPDGSWYGFIMRDSGAIGRVTNLCPIFWQDDWPVWGTPDAPHRVPAVARKPIQGQPLRQPTTSDDFNSPTLGLQWQWNHNPDNTKWSLTERPGCLRLHPTIAHDFWLARNTLTQKGQGPWCRGEVVLDLSHLEPGIACGFGTLGKISARIAIDCAADRKLSLRMEVTNDGTGTEMRVQSRSLSATRVWLRTDMDFRRSKGKCAYSLDGRSWENLGGEFPLAYDWRTGTFQGEQFAIFCYSPRPSAGFLDVESFRFSDQPDVTETGVAAPVARDHS